MAAGREGLTEEQRRAVGTRGVSVALSAGAGCGKTFVLTERFLAQFEPDAPGRPGRARLGQLVAITFTERAAREMRDRIRAACARRLIEAPEDQVDHWLELIRELDSARISTIHSFCGALLRSHAVEARLDPRFRVLDQAQADTLLYERLEEQLRHRLAGRDDAVIELVVAFGFDRLYEMIAGLLRRRAEIDWPQWRSETADSLVGRWEDHWRSIALPQVLQQVVDSPAAQRVLRIAGQHTPTNATMLARCELLRQRLPNLPQSNHPRDDLKSVRDAARVQGGGGKKAWANEQVYRELSGAAKELRELIDKRYPYVDFQPQAARPAAEAALRLMDVAAGVAEAYQQQKQQQGVLDFDDLLIHARQLLVGPGRQRLRKQLSSQIRLLLVDEFQDTDPLQVALVRALCDEELCGGKLFFVGDYKQSIYRFRGARPQVFRELRDSIPEGGRMPLSLNFRSQPAVLDFVNALFRDEMGREYEPLRPHRPQLGPEPAVEFLWATLEDPGPRAGREERLRQREADWIARRIRAMLDSGEEIVWDDRAAKAGEPAVRAVRPGDVALLFRALSNVEIYEEALRRHGIDYYLVGGHAFYAQQEIYDLTNLLRALDSPCDDVSLAGVLRSPFFSLLDETLYWLARHPNGLGAALAAGDWPGQIGGEQRRRVEFAAATLRRLRAMKDRLPIAQLIGEALRQTGYDAILLAEFLGERKLANLRKLISQARSFDRSGIFTLADFITQLSQFVARQPDEPLAATQPESTDVVRLMTIHQSKGLEFPVVIVPDVDRAQRGPSSSVAFTPQLGPMVKIPEAIGGFDLHMLAERDEVQTELVRLLYVATTRAADYLILSAGVPQLGAARGPWMDLIQRRFDPLTGRCRAAGVRAGGAEAGDPRGPSPASGDASSETVTVKVTTTPPTTGSGPSGAARRPDLDKLVEKARQMAAQGQGRVPPYLAPVEPDLAARRQYSFSRLTGTLHPRPPAGEVDLLEADAQTPRLDPLGLGTLVHAVLAEVDFGNPGDVAALVRRHARRHLPDAAAELDEPIGMIRRFLTSPRAAEIASAARVHPELEFLLAWPPGGRKPDGRYLQGFIDCLYRDAAGDWHLLDYKTNRVTAATLGTVAAGYEMQMLVYALAVEKILGRPPVELALSFLRPGLEHHFPWDDQARQRAVELVDRALS